MPSFRELRGRIVGVRNIQQITRAMKMVAGARLRRAEEAILALRPYSVRLDRLCGRYLQDAIGSEHPFYEERPVAASALLAIGSDRGLCGAYNNRIIDVTGQLLEGGADRRSVIFAVGHRAMEMLARRGHPIDEGYEEVFNPVHFETARRIARSLRDMFLGGEVDEVRVVFTEFFSPLRQHVAVRRLLPCHPGSHPQQIEDHYDRELPEGMRLEPAELGSGDGQVSIYEPDFEAVGGNMLEHNVSVQVFRALLEAQASEHGARMMAMDNATENAEEMIEELTLEMNRVRQESITSEILDVVGGAEAVQ